jgi:hypothetical protein
MIKLFEAYKKSLDEIENFKDFYVIPNVGKFFDMCDRNANNVVRYITILSDNNEIKIEKEDGTVIKLKGFKTTDNMSSAFLKTYWDMNIEKWRYIIYLVDSKGETYRTSVNDKITFYRPKGISSPLDPYGEEVWDD